MVQFLIRYTPLVFIFALVSNLYFNHIRPMRLSFSGKYEKALSAYENILQRSSFAIRKSPMNDIAIYNMADIYHKMGRFEDSLAQQDKLKQEKLKKGLESINQLLYGANLLMLNGDVEEAEGYFNKALPSMNLPVAFPIYCYLYVLQGDMERAKLMLDKSISEHKGLLRLIGTTMLITDRDFETTANNFFIGYYYNAVGDIEKAREHLLIASSVPYDNFYKLKAKSLLEEIV